MRAQGQKRQTEPMSQVVQRCRRIHKQDGFSLLESTWINYWTIDSRWKPSVFFLTLLAPFFWNKIVQQATRCDDPWLMLIRYVHFSFAAFLADFLVVCWFVRLSCMVCIHTHRIILKQGLFSCKSLASIGHSLLKPSAFCLRNSLCTWLFVGRSAFLVIFMATPILQWRKLPDQTAKTPDQSAKMSNYVGWQFSRRDLFERAAFFCKNGEHDIYIYTHTHLFAHANLWGKDKRIEKLPGTFTIAFVMEKWTKGKIFCRFAFPKETHDNLMAPISATSAIYRSTSLRRAKTAGGSRCRMVHCRS